MSKKSIKTLVKNYSPYDISDEDMERLEDEVGMFKCSCCGLKYPNGRESDDDVSVCDSCDDYEDWEI